MKFVMWAVVFLLILIGGYWFLQQGGAGNVADDLGTYAYVCNNNVEFTMTPASDVSSIRITPGANATFSGAVLTKTESAAGARYEGGGLAFIGAGEGVTLTASGSTYTCEPKPNPDMAPWNWGDPDEGGGVKQDVGQIVSESIVGTWQSTEDAKFTREFKDGGVAVDTYDGKDVADGTWKVFTKANPIEVPFPVEADAVYIQMTMRGTQADKLNFKLSKLTPEVLELIYMDRGGTLTFKSVK